MRSIGAGLVGFLLLAFLRGAGAAPTTAPAPAFFPPPANGHEVRGIVFVCDVSGATPTGVTVARRELQRAVSSLVGAQSFDLILTGSEKPLLFANTLAPASEANRQDACEWLEKAGARPRPSSLTSAIQAALALKPELVYLIESRNAADPATMRKQVGSLNRTQSARINVTTLIDDPNETGWTDAFSEIARRNGGLYTPIDLAAYGAHGATGIGGSIFALTPGQASAGRIIFVCDCSGSILNKIHSLILQLEKAVNALRPGLSFNLIFMSDQSCTTFQPGPVAATPQNQRDAVTFLRDKVTPRGETNAIPSLEAAFAQKPQLIFLLTDGDFPDDHAVLNRIRELNHAVNVPINTIAFVDKSDTDTDFITLLKQVAVESGGIYTFVKEDELRQ
jgi:hypothetical protein